MAPNIGIVSNAIQCNMCTYCISYYKFAIAKANTRKICKTISPVLRNRPTSLKTVRSSSALYSDLY